MSDFALQLKLASLIASTSAFKGKKGITYFPAWIASVKEQDIPLVAKQLVTDNPPWSLRSLC